MNGSVTEIELAKKGDGRGGLVVIEGNASIPFTVKRVYYIFNTVKGQSRGFHAHKNLKQLLICVKGSCRIRWDNGIKKSDILLNSPVRGLLLEGLIWREMHDFSEDCVLLVLASERYDEKDYIRNYEHFLEFIRQLSDKNN